jgi:hypothetical protein
MAMCVKRVTVSSFAVVLFSLFCWKSLAEENGVQQKDTKESSPKVDTRTVESLQLTRGTVQLGGWAGVFISTTIPDEGEKDRGAYLMLLPSLGVFPIDNFELLAGLGLNTDFEGHTYLSYEVGLRYIFDVSSVVYPYIGAMFGMSFSSVDSDTSLTSVSATVPLGILIGLNRHIAINMGLSFEYTRHLERDEIQGASTVSVPIGFFGVDAFF